MSFLDGIKEVKEMVETSTNSRAQVAIVFLKMVFQEIEYLEKEADWLAARMECDNDFTSEQEVACIKENGPCAKCLREAARRNVRG